jgi:acyl-coenzyme A synthetase/AMP-(fatty) acid ligase
MATIFGERLATHASGVRRVPAWVDGEREVGFDEVAGDVAALAYWFAEDGVAGASVVALTIADDRRHLVASLALLALGVPQVTLPTTEPVAMRSDLARRLGVDRVIADAGGEALEGAPVRYLPELARSGRGGPIAALRSDADAPAIYITSSGTTGRPKLFPYTQREIALRSSGAVEVEAHGACERIYVPARAQGFLARMTRLYVFLEGATSVLHDGSTTAAGIVERCLRTRATILHLSALQTASLAATQGAHGRLADGVKVFSTSSRLSAGTGEEFERTVGGRIYDRYGATEVGVLSSTFPRGGEGVPDAVGRVVPDAVVEIVDELGAPVPPGSVGEIRARTPQMTSGYVGDAELTRTQFRDGWFYPGDMGAITPGGVLRFLGRRDDMMSLGGIKIFPAEIERVLDAHPAIRTSAAFPVRSPVYGEIPIAAVELRTPDGATVAELVAYARERLGTRAPRRIEVVEAMPRNTAGKVLKTVLAGRFALAQGS